MTIAGQPLYITRADERCLRFLEARPKEFPYEAWQWKWPVGSKAGGVWVVVWIVAFSGS